MSATKADVAAVSRPRPPRWRNRIVADEHKMTLPPGKIRWGVRDVVDNMVVIEFECHDAYEAIEFADVCAAGLKDGKLTIEVSTDD